MATYNKFNSFVQAVAHGVHNLSTAQITVALTNTAPVATNTILSNITEITYTGLSSRNVTTISSGQTAGVYRLVLQDLTLTASGAIPTFRYVVIYNNTATNDELIAWADYGAGGVTLASGETFTIDFNATDFFSLT